MCISRLEVFGDWATSDAEGREFFTYGKRRMRYDDPLVQGLLRPDGSTRTAG